MKSRTAAAENLAEMLEFQGIRVSSIQFGPLAQYSTVSHSINRYVKHSSACLSLQSELYSQDEGLLATFWYMRWTSTL
jgi:hypothetical protein